jgi:hypothetical protein
MRKSALRRKNYRNSSAHNLAAIKAGPAAIKADPAAIKADPAAIKADPAVVKADPAVVKAGPVRVAVIRLHVRISEKPCSRNLTRTAMANSMKMNVLPVKKGRNFSEHNLAADKAAGLAVVKIGQALVNPDKVGRVRAVDLAVAAALADAAASDLPIP